MEFLRKLIGLCLTALQWLFSLIIGGVIFVNLLAGAFVTAIDVIAFLGTNDAKPIRRQFVVE